MYGCLRLILIIVSTITSVVSPAVAVDAKCLLDPQLCLFHEKTNRRRM
jgi:hypothetical protein